MSFKTITTSLEDTRSLRDRFKLKLSPFFVYRYDSEKNVYVFIRLGVDYDHPGEFFLVWDDMICKMNAYPTERFPITNGKPEIFYRITVIFVPKNFNKDVDMLIDILEQAFDDFRCTINDDIYIFKIIIDRQQLKRNIRCIE